MQVIGYARAGREFEVGEELRSHGFKVVVPRVITRLSRGKNRSASIASKPYLSNYIFMSLTEGDYHRLIVNLGRFKYLSHSFQIVPTVLASVMDAWIEATESEAIKAELAFSKWDTVWPYSPKDEMEVIGGPLLGFLEGRRVVFEKMNESAHLEFPMATVRASMMGREVSVDIDPLHLRVKDTVASV